MTVVDEHRVRHLFSANEAQEQFGIPAATIRSWARRERIYSYGLNERHDPMYDRDDLLKLRDRNGSGEYNRSQYKRSESVRGRRRREDR